MAKARRGRLAEVGVTDHDWVQVYRYDDGWVEVPASGLPLRKLKWRRDGAIVVFVWLGLLMLFGISVAPVASAFGDGAAAVFGVFGTVLVLGWIVFSMVWVAQTYLRSGGLFAAALPLIEPYGLPGFTARPDTAVEHHRRQPLARLSRIDEVTSMAATKVGRDWQLQVHYGDGDVRTFLTPYGRAIRMFTDYGKATPQGSNG